MELELVAAKSQAAAAEELRGELRKVEGQMRDLYERLGGAEKAAAMAATQLEAEKYKGSTLESQLSAVRAQEERDVTSRLREVRDDIGKLGTASEQRQAALEARLATKMDSLGTILVNALAKMPTATQIAPTPFGQYSMQPTYHMPPQFMVPPSAQQAPQDEGLSRVIQDYLAKQNK